MAGFFDFIKGASTSKNLTILGVLIIVASLASLAIPMLDGDPLTAPDWKVGGAGLATGLGFIMGKGAQSTGGTVPETAEAAKRIGG